MSTTDPNNSQTSTTHQSKVLPRLKKVGSATLLHLLLVALSFTLVLPFVWLILTSNKTLQDVGSGNWIPSHSAVLEKSQFSDTVLDELRQRVLKRETPLAVMLADEIDFEAPDLQRESLANQLTQRIIEGKHGLIYTPDRFADIELSSKTLQLMGETETALTHVDTAQAKAEPLEDALRVAQAKLEEAQARELEVRERLTDGGSIDPAIVAAVSQARTRRDQAARTYAVAAAQLNKAKAEHQRLVHLSNGWLLHDAFPDLIDHPRRIRWMNYLEVFRQIPFARYYANSLFIACWVTLLQVLTSSMAAFAFSRLQWPGRDKVFLLYLSTMMLPGLVVMIPNFQIMITLGWVDRFAGLIIPAAFTAFGTFLLRQFMLSIPSAMDEAAEIDGASKWQVYWNVILPMTRPGLITLAIFAFMFNYQSFFWPYVMLKSQHRYTLPIGLLHFDSTAGQETNLLMAATAMSIVPMILVFVLLQKYLVKGIQLGAVKG